MGLGVAEFALLHAFAVFAKPTPEQRLAAGCTDQSISVEADLLKVYLANRAFGAGGGNTTGGQYRSKDGLTWEKKMEKGWRAVSEAQQ